jgi:hypothetical protein
VDDLIRLKLVRADGDRLRLGFSYFTATDMALIHKVVAKRVPSLVVAYRRAMPKFDAIFRAYDVASVDRKLLRFDMIAGVGLNWDGLDLLDAGGWRKPVLVDGPGWRYSFWASEDTPGHSYKGYYWGSSSFPADAFNFKDRPLDFTFSSFGDPDSDPRMNFPDVVDLPADQFTPAVKPAAAALGFRDDDSFGLGLKNVLGLDLTRDAGEILFALRRRPMTADGLSAALTDIPTERLRRELDLLEAIAYVRRDRVGRYGLLVPVLDARDGPMVKASLAQNRRILKTWLARNYAPMRRELTTLTAVRQGVPYAALYTQIWHEVFGLTTRELVAGGLLADPYAAANPAPGSLGLVWRTAIYHHNWR